MKLTTLFEQGPALASPEIGGAAQKAQTEPPVEPIPGAEGGEQQAGYADGEAGYTIDMIIGQIRGVIKPWMQIASRYPEGEQRHNFMEIGERLSEIANTLERDFNQ